jgi:hypothetical protein
MRAEDQHITGFQRDGDPFVSGFPLGLDTAVFGKFDFHSMGSRDDFQTAVFDCCGVDGDVGGDVLNAADVVVGRGVEVGLEAVSVGLFVVDFLFEE